MPTTPSTSATGATSVVVPVQPPRNPYQQLARQRRAGAHDDDARKRRRLEKNALRDEIRGRGDDH